MIKLLPIAEEVELVEPDEAVSTFFASSSLAICVGICTYFTTLSGSLTPLEL